VLTAVTYVCAAKNERAFLASVNIYVEIISPLSRTQNFGVVRQKTSWENEVLSRTAIKWTGVH
jgi:hypothetical protein